MLTTLNSSFLFLLQISQNVFHLETTIDSVSTWMSPNLLSLNQSKTEFLLIGLPKQLSEVSDATLHMPSNVTINPSDSARPQRHIRRNINFKIKPCIILRTIIQQLLSTYKH